MDLATFEVNEAAFIMTKTEKKGNFVIYPWNSAHMKSTSRVKILLNHLK